jgi:hypothetical protein
LELERKAREAKEEERRQLYIRNEDLLKKLEDARMEQQKAKADLERVKEENEELVDQISKLKYEMRDAIAFKERTSFSFFFFLRLCVCFISSMTIENEPLLQRLNDTVAKLKAELSQLTVLQISLLDPLLC